jgi:hypothetical protein
MWHISQHNSITHNEFSRCRSARPVSLWPGESIGRIAWRHGWQWTSPPPRSPGNDAMMPCPVPGKKTAGESPGWFHQNKSRDVNDDLMVLNHVNTLVLLSYSNESPWVHDESWWIILLSKIITVPILRRWYWINYHWVVTVIPVTHWMFGVDSGGPQKWPRHPTQDLRMIGEVLQDLREMSAPRCLKFCSGWSQIRGRCLRKDSSTFQPCEFQHMRTSIHTQLSRPFSARCPLCRFDHSCNCGHWLSSGKPLCHI